MSLRRYANAPATALTSGITALSTTMTLDSVTGLPITYPYILIIDRGQATEEVVLATGAAGSVVTVTRGYDSTTAFSHEAGAEVVHGISAIDPREANEHVNATSNVHGVVTPVGATETQTLTNKDLTSGTNTFPSTLATDAEVTSAVNSVNSTVSAHTALTAAHGATGAVVGTTNTQTLTNKNLASGTNTFPTTLATLNDTQTLTNKTLASPTFTGVGNRVFAVKPSDETATTTEQFSDSNLSVNLPEAGTWAIDMWLCATASGTDPDIAMSFQFGGTLSAIQYGAIGAPDLSMTSLAAHSVRSTTTSSEGGLVRAGLNGSNTNFIVRGFLTALTSGLLIFEWGQEASSAQTVTLRRGSWLRCERVA